jgi:hypothetical protein
MGMSRTELQPLIDKTFQEQSPGVLAVKVPKPHPDFETYLVIVSPTHGLCRISALGKNISMNSFGDQVKDSFTEMRQVLEGRYGQPEVFDYLKVGSIWKDADDWAMALSEEERTLAAVWKSANVILQAKALDRRTAYLTIIYDGPQFLACREELRKASSSVL